MQRTPGVDPGPVWHTGVWPRHGTCVAYRVVNEIKYPPIAVCYIGPLVVPWWLWAICSMRVRDQVVLDVTQVHHVGKVYNSAEIKSIWIAMPAVSGMLWWSHSD